MINNNPLDTNAFRHYLKFISLGRTDLYEICEPIGFDAANFVKSQELKKYARSIEYGSIDKLTFVDALGVGVIAERPYNLQGDSDIHLDYGLGFLLPIYFDYGFQAKVEYILEKDGVQFSGGMLDFTEKDITDGWSFISCKLIQNNKVADLKRRLDDKFNLYGTVNAKNEIITAASPVNFLLRATPLNQSSEWRDNGVMVQGGFIATNQAGIELRNWVAANNAQEVISYEIDNSLSYISPSIQTGPDGVPGDENFVFIQALNDISELKIDLSGIDAYTVQQKIDGIGGPTVLTGNANIKFVVQIGLSIDTIETEYVLYEKSFGFVPSTAVEYLPTDFTLTIPLVRRGYRIYIYAYATGDATFSSVGSGTAIYDAEFKMTTINIKMSGISTSIDTVVKGLYWIDGLIQASKFTSNIPVNAALFDISGIHENNIIFNREGISQRTDTFTATPKIMFESVEEVNCDYEPTEDEIFIGHESDFYVNEEIAFFNIIPSEDFSIQENDKCMINKFQYKYNTYEQNRLTEGTDNAIHTESEWRLLNDNVENIKEIALEFVRDPLSIQAMVDLEVTQPTTSTNEDDKIYITEIVELEPGSFNEFGARLLMKIVSGNVEILNRDSEGDSDNVVINWAILGFVIGDTFEITYGENIGVYTVATITTSVVTLTPTAFTPTFEGDAFIKVKYYYTGVSFVSRTMEGFLSNPLKLQNVNYSIKRNMGYFGEYLAACELYEKTDIINGYFKSNGAYTSQLLTETDPITENATITYGSLPNPLITPKVYTLNCVAEFQDILDYLEAYKISRGFVRCLDSNGKIIKGYVQKLDHLWQENKLQLVLEEKFQTQYLILTYSLGILTVDDAPYNLSGISNWYIFNNDYIKLYDDQNRPLTNGYKYNFVNLNGVIYGTKAELVTALLSL